MTPQKKEIAMRDKTIAGYFVKEAQRQNEGIELIASENYPSVDVRQACGSIFTAKYAEGYPGHRYYGGCENIDAVEQIAIDRACKLFACKFANVQPHSGCQANFAAYHALINPGDTVLSLVLNDGGHLTHGSPVSFSAQTYKFVHYPLDASGRLDYDLIAKCIAENSPNLFLAGYSAYPYDIDFQRIRGIIDEHNKTAAVHCYYMVDMAHIAGIVAAGLCQNPCLCADLVTTTTHKTLRGPRGGLILSNNEAFFKKINSAVFPYTQGGPLDHIIAAKAVCFEEDLQPEFREYMKGVLANTKACDEELAKLHCVVSGTDNHLFLLNVLASFSLTGLEAQKRLESIGITTNKNMLHGDVKSAAETSGIRLGFAAATTRGCTEKQARQIARIIFEALRKPASPSAPLAKRVHAITKNWKDVMTLRFPLR